MNKLLMKRLGLGIFLVILSAPGLAPAQEPPGSSDTNALSDCLYFRNGDLLYGKLLAIEPHDAVRWRHPDSPDAIEFKPESIVQINFPPQRTDASRAKDSCKLSFANGDSLEGDLVSSDRDTVTLQTWYAGRLKIPRRSLQSLAFPPRDPAVFDGITGLDGWTEGNTVQAFMGEAGQWIYRNGAFYADKPASIARDLKLPGKVQIQFDLAWKGTLNLAVALYTDSLQPILLASKDAGPDFGGFYSLRFNPVSVSITRIRKNEPLTTLGEIIIPSLNLKTRLHVDIRVNKEAGKIALFFDGTPIKEWVDPSGFVGEGTGVRFVQNPSSAIKRANLRVTRWNGVLEDDTSPPPDFSHDVITLASGANVSGTIEAIANGQISILTAGGPSQVPVVNTSAIALAHAPPEASAETAAVRATFARGGAISCELVSWRPDALLLVSPDFGRATFDPAAFSRLQFLAPEPKTPDTPKS
jgi:hypothetical protein